MLDPETRINELERELRQLNRTVAGIQHYLKVAADYLNDDPQKRVEAVQAALGQAAKYEGRSRTRMNGRKHREP